MYITSQGAVFKLNLKTKIIGTVNTNFFWAIGCAVYKFGTLYIADELDIRKITSSGNLTTILSGLDCYGCIGIYFDPKDQMLVTDFAREKLYRVNMTDSSFVTLAGSSSNGLYQYVHLDGPDSVSRLSNPNGMVQDRFGNTFIAEWQGQSISWLNTSNYLVQIAGGGNGIYQSPSELVMDSYGRLFVSERFGRAIRMITWY